MTPRVFGEFYKGYEDARLPSEDMLAKILVSNGPLSANGPG